MIRVKLFARWESREPATSNDSQRLSRFVNGLPDFDPVYASWLRSPTAEQPVLPVPLSEAEAKQFLIDNLGRYDVGGVWPEFGSFFRAGNAGPPPYNFRDSAVAVAECLIGAYGDPQRTNPNKVFLDLSEIRSSTGRPWRASELRPLMKFVREVWNPAEMCAIPSFYIADLPNVPDPAWAVGKRTLKPWIGWITYLPPDLASRAKYPSDTHVESLGDGAALATLCEEPFDKDDAEGMARLHALEAALRPIQS